MNKILIVGLVMAAAASAAVGARAAPKPERPPLDAAQLFSSKCAVCHDRNGWGTRTLAKRLPADQAELLQRKALPSAFVKMVVRRGIGSMPQFTPTDLTDEELGRLALWLESERPK